MNALLEPFSYEYMLNAMWVSAMLLHLQIPTVLLTIW